MKKDWKEGLKKLKKALNFEREEEKERHEREIKTMSGYEREKKGRALMDMRSRKAGQSLSGEYIYQFRKNNRKPLPDIQIKIGDELLISQGNPLDKRNSMGTVYEVSSSYISLACRDILRLKPKRPIRLDLYLNDIAYKRMEQALNYVMDNRNSRAAKLIRGEMKNKRLENIVDIKGEQLNESQILAVKSALEVSSHQLIQGPSGTGKTHTAVELIKMLNETNDRILVTAQSNAAADNILRKLDNSNVSVMRIGNPIRVNKDLIDLTLDSKMYNHKKQVDIEKCFERIEILKLEQKNHQKPERRYTRGLDHNQLLNLANEKRTTRGIPASMIMAMKPWLEIQMEINNLFEQIKELRCKAEREIFDEHKIIVTTNVTAGADILEGELFDVLVMDEAAQANIPSSLIAVQKAKKLILIGDFKQLPPTILSQEAKTMGLDVSLMEHIYLTNKDSNQMLNLQYRMNKDINDLTSELFYEGKLKSDKSVMDRILVENEPTIEWINIDSEEKLIGQSHVNCGEAEAVFDLVSRLRQIGVEGKNIAIITPYKAQVNFIEDKINDESIEIDTVDSFQGREKEIVIMSFVRQNKKGQMGFLTDYRRLNVSISRAKTHLYLIGNKNHLSKDSVYKRLIDRVEKL
ncbi:MAG: IGHMBP2 family helicase [Tissierellales bacterium]|jgi:predicted DNA helicase|nr:IGHMBP2 family helicase [Tissierellales bacterium]